MKTLAMSEAAVFEGLEYAGSPAVKAQKRPIGGDFSNGHL